MSSAFLTSFEVYNAVSFAEGKASAVDLQDLPISHDRRSTPIEQHPAFHSPSAPATTIYSLLLWAPLCWIPRMGGIMKYLSLRGWLISLHITSSSFIHVVTYYWIFSLWRLINIPLHVHTTYALSMHLLTFRLLEFLFEFY